MTVVHQVSMLTAHYTAVRGLLEGKKGACLVKVTLTSVVRRTLAELLSEIGMDDKRLL
jgi:hypothetical protein